MRLIENVVTRNNIMVNGHPGHIYAIGPRMFGISMNLFEATFQTRIAQYELWTHVVSSVKVYATALFTASG